MDIKRETNKDEKSLLAVTAKGASYLILLQFISRMLTFLLNQIVLRYVSKATFGIASVNLELLASTILFISREGFRSALIRSSKKPQTILNLAYIPTCFGVIITFLTCIYYLSTISEEEAFRFPYYRMAVLLYGAASFLELTVEPLFVLALNHLHFQLRVTVEGVAVIVKCLVTFSLTIYFAGNEEYSILAFAIAQFVFGFIMMMGYLGFFLYKEKSFQKLLPHQIVEEEGHEKYWFDKQLLHLGITMTKQSFLKHILTEGDKMLISVLSSVQDRGVYAFVVNYGSLIVRILFQPLEETGRTFFSRLLLSTEKVKKEDCKMAANVLLILIKFHVLLGLLFICFGTNYTSTLIDLLVGKKWSLGEGNAPGVLAMYCIYVPFMGINGITEGFVQAVASKKDLTRLSYYMIFFSTCFMLSGFIFMYILQLGANGLVIANMVNLGVRISYSWYYIRNYMSSKQVTLSVYQWFPHVVTLSSFVLAWFVTYWSKNYIGWYTFKQKVMHITVGGICFLFISLVIFWKEKGLINEIKKIKKSK
ncbi:Rft protein-domain-containing protein [Cokeromyces recurvatus]|uniref:Rft protein-domain-containing protein n=1 Tax=Cokeromyces recurvatus TaxID=90255 RepID=UPI00221F9895|nr:Rft protein-domain-containing protein [Cokeromyces recurvatus]KAI7901104.1 Rft protein-domain-containing protein [Cokeromyces recurvatus]